MMKSGIKMVALAAFVGALSGCVTQMQGIKVTHTLPNDRALAYLQDLDASFNARAHAVGAPQCTYSENGITGSKVVFLLVGSSSVRGGDVAYGHWYVDEIRMVKGVSGPFYTLVVKNPAGEKCAPLRSPAGTSETLVTPKIEEALTALVSLGVQYDPNRLGSK